MKTTKKSQAGKRTAKSNTITDAYVEYVLVNGRQPASVYKFCLDLGIKEEEFYNQYGSFEALEKHLWKGYIGQAIQTLTSDSSFADFNAREKMLALYFTLAEILKSNRSFVLHQLNHHRKPELVPSFLKEFKHDFEEFVGNILTDGKSKGEVAERPYLDKRYPQLFWIHMSFLLLFWKQDDSAGFEKTDAFIEKSVNLAFDLIGKGALDSAIDFLKVPLPNKFEIAVQQMKEFSKIPVTKVERATKFIATGAKIGKNYIKHYSKKLVDPTISRDELHQDNAKDIYNSLSELKGSALKVAQMLSMDKNLLPAAYQQKFSMAQYSAPPLSYPLVVKTFQKYFGKGPEQLFESFSRKAVNAASMGQVHLAEKDGKKLAVKIQYPGVGDSVKSDLAMVKPIALKMFKLNPVEYDEFIQEVEMRMMEETDYALELERSIELSVKSKHIPNIIFPTYYKEYSSPKILTMDWVEGKPLGEVLKAPLPKGVGTTIGQAMWDFYHFQMHTLKSVHADPHPGNFIITNDYKLGIIDFGCVKVIPETFYNTYFQLLDRSLLEDKHRMERVFYQLRFIYEDDSRSEKAFFTELFTNLVELLSRPFQNDRFDFADKVYFETLFAFGEKLSGMKELRESKKARGVRDALYINRTYFGLYNILHDLQATVHTRYK